MIKNVCRNGIDVNRNNQTLYNFVYCLNTSFRGKYIEGKAHFTTTKQRSTHTRFLNL